MPKAIKKRVSRKTGSKEEEVKSAAVRLLDKAKGKKNVLVPALIVSCTVIILIAGFIFYSSSMKNKAHDLEMEAYKYYYQLDQNTLLAGEDRWKKPLELFRKSIETRSAPTPQFYLGNCYFNLGDYENAVKAYSKFIEKYGSEEILLPLVYQKLAAAYIKAGKGDEAVKTLDALAGFKKGMFKATALILEARYYDESGRHEDALAKCRELVAEFPNSQWSAEARAKTAAQDKKGAVETGEQESLSPEGQLELPKAE